MCVCVHSIYLGLIQKPRIKSTVCAKDHSKEMAVYCLYKQGQCSCINNNYKQQLLICMCLRQAKVSLTYKMKGKLKKKNGVT